MPESSQALPADDILFMAGRLDAVAMETRTGMTIDENGPDRRISVLRAVSTADGTARRRTGLRVHPCMHRSPPDSLTLPDVPVNGYEDYNSALNQRQILFFL